MHTRYMRYITPTLSVICPSFVRHIPPARSRRCSTKRSRSDTCSTQAGRQWPRTHRVHCARSRGRPSATSSEHGQHAAALKRAWCCVLRRIVEYRVDERAEGRRRERRLLLLRLLLRLLLLLLLPLLPLQLQVSRWCCQQ